MNLMFRRDRTTSARRHPRTFRPGLQLTLEGLEERTMLSTTAVAAPAAQVARPNHTTNINILPQLNVTNVNINSLASTVTVALGNVTQTLNLGLSATPNPADPACPILNLELGPINLNLLGLNVATSEICLDVTAHPGEGLLGDLLCGLSNALSGGTLTNFLSGLTTTNLNTLIGGVTNLLNGALDALTTTGAPGTAGAATPGVSGTTAGATDILNLSLGPIDLNLLGLQVELDDCNDGPVTVDITAQPGGGLLGDLLSNLNNLLNNNGSNRAINQLLTNIGREIDRLV